MYRSRADGDQTGGLAFVGGAHAPAAALARDQIVRGFDWRHFLAHDLVVDLGSRVGSRRWYRGLATFAGLSALAIALWPDIAPLPTAPLANIAPEQRTELRSQMILPLALGADSGRHMGATALVEPLAAAPERPRIEVVATYARGDGFGRMLARAGLGEVDAIRVADLVSSAMPLGEIEPGTQFDITLGRRPAPDRPRALEALTFRARFDLALEVTRIDPGAPLALVRKPIRVDDTPLRIRGTVGDSLYRSARAAGAPASAVQAYLKTLGQYADLGSAARPGDTFDFIIAHRRAATGERQAGQLLYAGVERGGKPRVQLMRWGKDGQFYEASGVGEQRGGLTAPVAGRVGSRFGMRRHPILKYVRLHAGLDYKAAYGAPIVAVTDGTVQSAGRAGGCGIAVKLAHGGGIQTRYCHMSRMAVGPGQRVRRGQVIGYVGSTGLSTGAHLHYEMYRGGRPVDPASVKYVTRAQLSGAELVRFRETLKTLKLVEAGAALADLAPTPEETRSVEPQREIDRLAN